MTAPAHPQQEYIITEEQIKKLMNYTFDGFTSDKELEDSKEIFIKIRSRPHSSVQSRDQEIEIPELGVVLIPLRKDRTRGSRDP